MIVFTVAGRGVFPMDMLRHDMCWPASTSSAFMIHQENEYRSINMQSHVHPTSDRWSSFGWHVTHLES